MLFLNANLCRVDISIHAGEQLRVLNTLVITDRFRYPNLESFRIAERNVIAQLLFRELLRNKEYMGNAHLRREGDR